MPLPRAVPVTLAAAERTTLKKRARGAKTAHRDRLRAQIVLAAGRLRDAYPNAIMIHTPVHASWLNQIEIVFSIIQKKALTPNNFPGLGTLSHALLAFVNRYNRTARPFNWKFTADDLTALLHRISQREQAASQQAALSQAA